MTRDLGLLPHRRLLLQAAKVSFASRAAYRGDFLLSLLVTVLFEAVTPLVTVLIYSKNASFPGWSMPEALLIQSLFLAARGIAYPAFFGIVWSVFDQVREGSFELTLLKPRPPLVVLLAESFDAPGFGRFIGGAALFCWAASNLPAPGLAPLLLTLVFFCLSILVLFSFALLMAGSLFVFVGNGRVQEVSESIMIFAQYPSTIYGKGLQVALATIVPISMIAVLPAQAFLGRPGPLATVAAPACVLFFCGSLAFWRVMMKRYAGGGG
jgi:ABC-2 type transport system permease protein